jgi:uncharacterized protein (DUF1330 family)
MASLFFSQKPLQERTMAKAYFVSIYHAIHDENALAAYAKLAGPALVAGGGRVLSRGMPAVVKEQGEMMRTVLIEFDSVEIALKAYDSPAYKEALALLGNAVDREIRILEGV